MTEDEREPYGIDFDATDPRVIETMAELDAILRTLVATARSLATTLYDAANALEVQRKAAKRPADDDVKP